VSKLKGLSLFANVGIAETYLAEIGFDVVVANEIDERRVRFYKHLYPDTLVIAGDITNKLVREEVINKSIENDVEFIIATPPCQGMSLAGKRDPHDPRNQLISYAIDIIKKIRPKYVFLENVPQQQKTKIFHVNKTISIPEYIERELMSDYIIPSSTIIRCMDHSIPQIRARNIYLLVRKDLNKKWVFPEKDPNIISLKDAIGHLPPVDPVLREGMDETLKLFPDFEEKQKIAAKYSKYHMPPKHAKRHVQWMMHTPTGKSAFDNKIYFPKKESGERINGHYNTYRRHVWDKPARTIIMNNGVISSLCCVHPGRVINESKEEKMRLYSDARVLTLLEIFIVSSIPIIWNVPSWESENFVRNVVGEGIPPLLVKKIFSQLIK
jgi:DNA (cytosine-5)-methyltransferase 1